MRFPRTMLLLFILMIILVGCGGKEEAVPGAEDPDEGKIPIQEEIEEELIEDEVAPYTYILTGKPSEEEVLTRAVSVMIENQLQARPQTGLDQADVVYEILAEGDITRFVAIYQSQAPENLGPVRSIRPYYIRLGEALDAIIVHAGWSPAAEKILKQEKKHAFINEVHGDHLYFWRSKDRKAPHNVYTSMENIRKAAQDKKYRDEWSNRGLLFYEQDEQVPGDAVQQVDIKYIGKYVVTYEYDNETGLFARSMEGKPHLDKETEKQLTASNIIIGHTKHKVLDNDGRREVDIQGPGKGYLVQQGKVREITWELHDGLVRAFINGVEQALIPGQTWIQLVPESAAITFDGQKAGETN